MTGRHFKGGNPARDVSTAVILLKRAARGIPQNRAWSRRAGQSLSAKITMLEIFSEIPQKLLLWSEDVVELLLTLTTQQLTASGALATAIGAWATFFIISRRTVQLTWTVGFREQYAEFWRDEFIGAARRWITSNKEYDGKIKSILSARIKTEENELDEDQNRVLDQIDRLLASLTRMHYFTKSGGTWRQRRIWRGTYEKYWVKLIRSRPELLVYVRKYWPRLEI
jgi:hypothetical protein